MNDLKAKLLKITKEQSQWENERDFLIAKIDVLNEYQLILEKEREEKEKNKQVEMSQLSTETSTKAIVQAMSQVRFRDEEIKGLKRERETS